MQAAGFGSVREVDSSFRYLAFLEARKDGPAAGWSEDYDPPCKAICYTSSLTISDGQRTGCILSPKIGKRHATSRYCTVIQHTPGLEPPVTLSTTLKNSRIVIPWAPSLPRASAAAS